jgi:hypothetical protein
MLIILLVISSMVTSAAASKRPVLKPAVPIARLGSDPLSRSAFSHFYSMEFDKAVSIFEQVARSRPDDPFAVNHLLSGVMFKEMYRIGALDSELYAKEQFLASKQFPMDPKVKARIDELTQRALSLEEAKLNQSSNDADALYARGVTRGLHATYLALIEKAWFSGLRSAVGARHDHERVLELQPNNADARMIVGMHNYVVGSLSWPAKVGVAPAVARKARRSVVASPGVRPLCAARNAETPPRSTGDCLYFGEPRPTAVYIWPPTSTTPLSSRTGSP